MEAPHPAELDERGIFWWSDVGFGAAGYAPRAACHGRLIIEYNGRCRLDLDEPLPRARQAPALLERMASKPISRSIAGILTAGSRYVLISNLAHGPYEFNANGPSRESFHAFQCLVGPRRMAGDPDELRVATIEVSLEGFEAWLRLGGIRFARASGALTTTFEPPPPHAYALPDGQLEMTFHLPAPFHDTRVWNLEFREHARLTFTPHQPLSIADAVNWFGRMEDLMVLLTDAERALPWPRVGLADGDGVATLYFNQGRRKLAEVREHDTWTNFIQLQARFGDIVAAWYAELKRVGSGFYLYLATRRGSGLYSEHRFVSLIWGLESLHRRTVASSPNSPGLDAKIRRILDQVAAKKDRRWLETQLSRPSEPSLEFRLSEVIAALPFEFDPTRVTAFAKACADRRNDISHFGGLRETGEYDPFVSELARLSYGLDLLYHARILQLIGLGEDALVEWFERGPNSFILQKRLRHAGLLSPDPTDQDDDLYVVGDP